MSKQPNYDMDRRERERAKQAKKAAKAEDKAAAKRNEVVDPATPPTPNDRPTSDRR